MNFRNITILGALSSLLLFTFIITAFHPVPEEADKGVYSYGDFEKSMKCRSCHVDFYEQWSQSMMSQAYTHHWDEIEYFDLAVPHAEKDSSLKDAVDGCNGCHSPFAFLSGELPPARPAEGTMANESVSCDVCHLIKGSSTDPPYNHSYIIEPGRKKFSARENPVESPAHKIEVTNFHRSTELCGTCHNEKNPFGVWVKSTQLEWKEGPYAKEDVRCQDCHMPPSPFIYAAMGQKYDDARHHLFHGAHDPGKVRGTIELRIHPDIREVVPGSLVMLTVALFNQKTGHKFPTGSVEDRIVWLHVEAEDEQGNVYHLPVDKKGFEGEEYTIAGDYLAYQDLAIPLGLENFEGLQRDGIPEGDRIFRMPYLDAQGNMTIMQWNATSLGVDYRIGPRETKTETFTFEIPFELVPGEVKVTAKLNYQLLVRPVAEFLNVPEEESEIMLVNSHSTSFTVLP